MVTLQVLVPTVLRLRLGLGTLPFYRPFVPPSSEETGHLQGDQNLFLLEPAVFSTIMDNAPMTDVVSRTSVGFASADTPPVSAQSGHQTIEHCTLPESVVSSINVDLLEFHLKNHPSPQLVHYVLSGFREGFDIGFIGDTSGTRPNNLLSARHNPNAVTVAIRKEVSRGHTSGPFRHPPFDPFHCSPLGAVPKKDGSVRIILDLSSPRGFAINEGIPKDLFTVKYSSFDDAVSLVQVLGPGAFMAKLDVRHAFRLCPVRPDQWGLLGYCWQDEFFVDTRLPFGSRSSPFIFNTFADLLLWILIYVGGIRCVIHYLDDFFICAPSAKKCQDDMEVMQSIFSTLGVPLASDKTVGPVQCLTFLGIDIDVTTRSIRLPPDKFQELSTSLRLWLHKKKCTKRELLSLIGSLSFLLVCQARSYIPTRSDYSFH